MMPVKSAILISGRGSNMEAIINASQNGILKGICEIVLVVSNKENAPGLNKATALNIPVQCIPSAGKNRAQFEQELINLLKEYSPEYIILAGFNRVLTSYFIGAYSGRIINIHPADTEEYQGLHGYQWAFENRLPETKITVHLVDEGIDTGKVLAKKKIDLQSAVTLGEVEQRGLAEELKFYSEVLRNYFLSLKKN